MTREFAGHESHRKRLEYNEEKDRYQMQCKIEEMGKRVCKAWYSVTLNVLENFLCTITYFYNSIPRRIADLIEANGDTTKY